MAEFLKLLPPEEARTLLLDQMAVLVAHEEEVSTASALHRITALPIRAPHALPEFSRSTVDGYALMARDTFGASGTQPAYLEVVGEVAMGASATFALRARTCALIHTGGMLPVGADAIIMLENTQRIGAAISDALPGREIEVLKAVAPGENVIGVGEDVVAGQTVIEAGREIRAQEIGGLMALGLTSVRVRKKPRLAIISSGDEIVEPDVNPKPGQVRDVNAQCLAAMVADHGSDPILFGIVPDEPGRLLAAARRALEECDVVVITAGSSASTRDLTAVTVQALGSSGCPSTRHKYPARQTNDLGRLRRKTRYRPARQSGERVCRRSFDGLACHQPAAGSAGARQAASSCCPARRKPCLSDRQGRLVARQDSGRSDEFAEAFGCPSVRTVKSNLQPRRRRRPDSHSTRCQRPRSGGGRGSATSLSKMCNGTIANQ